MKTVVLIILDGWGLGEKNAGNPIYAAQPKNIGYLKANFLTGALQASGIAVGLPWGEEGNSEIGHLIIGAGKIIYQHFPRISTAVRNGEFFKNDVLLEALKHAKKNNSAVNLIGLLTEGNVHASLEHLLALMEMADKNGISEVKLHLFSDGKDSAPKSLLKLLNKMPRQPATISGRYYALDRDKHWDRTQKTYEILVGDGPIINDWESHIKKYYDRQLNDEFIEPFIVGPEKKSVQENDSVIFFNFREDSIRQIASAFIMPDFQEFPVKKFRNLHIVAMTKYSDRFPVPVAFPPESVDNPLGKVLSDHRRAQLRIAETEKYAHITYFFNGFKDQPMPNEYRVLIPSRNVPRHDQYPEMMAAEIAGRVIQAVEERGFDFILANFANPDVIAHTGNFEAALKAIQTVDEQIGKILQAVLAQKDDALIITSDHGNIETMVNLQTYLPETKHDPGPVPIYLAGNQFKKPKDAATADLKENTAVGLLSDVAPTVLNLLNIPKPKEMTGQSLLRAL
jgi:2,3-bisphosphoglycerate-independent phosphoglycerate mutase